MTTNPHLLHQPCTRTQRQRRPGPNDERSEIRGGSTTRVSPDRVLSTVMFVDVVSSTERVAAMGDRPWIRLLERLLAGVGREVERHGGAVVKHTGDGLAATFDSATRAIGAAVAATTVACRHGVQLRCGLHTGEIERHPRNRRSRCPHRQTRLRLGAAGAVLMSRTTPTSPPAPVSS